MHDARRLRRRLRRIDRDDPRLLRDVRILRIVHDAAPGAVGDAEQAAGRIPRRRFALERRQRPARSAAGGRHRHGGAVALDLEHHAAIGGDRRPIRVARERGQAARAAAGGRRRPQIERAGGVDQRHVHRRAVERERDRPVDVEVGIGPDRRTAARDRHARSAGDRRDAGDLSARREGRERDAVGHPARFRGRAVRRQRPELLPVAAVDDAGDDAARARPGELPQVGDLRGRRRGSRIAEARAQRIVVGPQPAP